MSREILYKKTDSDTVKVTKNKTIKEVSNVYDSVKKNEPLIEWIKSHSLINISALCREAGINRSNFDKSLKMGIIPSKHEKILSDILKKYGY